MKNVKHLSRIVSIFLITGFLAFHAPGIALASSGTDTVMIPGNFPDIAEKARPSVVNIRTENTVSDI